MSTSQKILLVWGMVLLFVVLAASLALGPKAAVAPALVKAAHGHALCLASLMLLMMLLQPCFRMSEVSKRFFAVLLSVGATILPLGVLVELGSKVAGGLLSTFGSVFVVITVLVYMIGAITYVATSPPTSPQSK